MPRTSIARYMAPKPVIGVTDFGGFVPPRILRKVLENVARRLIEMNIPMQEVYAQYSDRYLEWVIPPACLPVEYFEAGRLLDEDTDRQTQPAEIVKSFRDAMASMLKEGRGSEVLHYATLFAIRCLRYRAITFSEFDEENAYVVLRGHAIVGVKNKVIIGGGINTPKDAVLPDIMTLAYLPGGTTKVNTFDLLDQLKMWMSANREKVLGYEELEHALAAVKLRGSGEGVYAFQQMLYRKDLPDNKPASAEYTDELLQKIRDMWDGSGLPLSERYAQLCSMTRFLSITSASWGKMFGTRVREIGDKLPARQFDRVNNGIEAFIIYFLQQQERERKRLDANRNYR